MADFVFGRSLGRIAQRADDVLAGGNDAFIWIPMSASGTAEQAEGLNDFAAVEADANFAEDVGAGWSRIVQDETGDGLTVTFDTVNNRTEVDSNDLVWAGPTATNATGLVCCYDPDTTAGTDSTLEPLVHLTMAVVPNGQQVTFQHNAEGWFNATRT